MHEQNYNSYSASKISFPQTDTKTHTKEETWIPRKQRQNAPHTKPNSPIQCQLSFYHEYRCILCVLLCRLIDAHRSNNTNNRQKLLPYFQKSNKTHRCWHVIHVSLFRLRFATDGKLIDYHEFLRERYSGWVIASI